jgi:hypothetical protein
MSPKEELASEFVFRHGPIGDPVPWVLIELLDAGARLQVARLWTEYQLSVNAAQANLLRGFQGLFQAGTRPAAKP